MTRTNLAPWEIIITLIAVTMLSVSNALSADQQVVTDDGREVLLKQDGTWQFRSNDRFANTKDGQRVRLKQDGSWEYVGNAPLASKQRVRTNDLDIKIEKVVIETHEKKVQKNKRVKSQTVFYLNLQVSPLVESAVRIKNADVARIKVTDNNGKDYPVLSIQPSPATLEPNTKTTLIIRTDGSPLWWKNVKSMEIVFSPGILGIHNPIRLSNSVIDIDKKNVDSFENSN